jgi:ribulose-phosphate 3-epimerase
VRSWINSEGLENKVDIQVDGGINDQTILEAKVAGANVFVVGNYVFGNRDIARSIDRLKELIPDVK